MASCVNYNCTELGTHAQNDCNTLLLGGVPEAILLLCGHTVTDPSSASQITANIASGKAKKIIGVKIEITKASPVNIPSDIGGEPDTLVNYTRNGTMVDANVSQTTVNFYNDLLTGMPIAGMIIHESDAEQVTWINEIMKFTGSRVIPGVVDDRQRWEIDFTWKSKYEGSIYSVPVGIFSY